MKNARALVTFHTVKTEGGLLPLDLLQRIVLEDKTLSGLSDEAYHLINGERLRDAINRSWSQLTTVWKNFQTALEKVPESDRAMVVTRDRWLLPLFKALDFGHLPKSSEEVIDGKTYAITHRYQHSPIHLIGCRVKLDDPQRDKGGRSITAHGLTQDYLNRSEGHLWGFVSNGFVLRILRDHHSLTQQAYVEFDLQAMMEGEHFSEFCLLWLLCHQSRVDAEKPEECWLEKWSLLAREEGVRALDKLRDGVEKAIMALGSGFLKHKANKRLQRDLEEGTLSNLEFYGLLRRLVYRMIFMFVAEDREALNDPKASPEAHDRYRRWYATRLVRELADKRRGGPHGDLWQRLLLVMRKLATGSAELALPALGSFLWRRNAIGLLDECDLSNEHLLGALRELCYVEHGKTRYAVSWRNIGSEELGSVFEGLLERHPKIHRESGFFELDTAAGHERKTTGSYYTPKSLVECLLDSALEPVLNEAAQKGEQAILDLKVCDPACGSGHFLVAAARRIATRLASVRTGGDEPSPREVDRALRDVVGRCIYGVDLNPMAVELCKVSLWMEAIEPGKPLSFLEAHIRQGNALLGTTPKLMDGGIPDEAFEVLEGDDKDVAKRLKKRNKDERKGQTTWLSDATKAAPVSYGRLSTGMAVVEAAADDNLKALEKKESDWDRFTESKEYTDGQLLADAWCAAFVWPKEKAPPLNDKMTPTERALAIEKQDLTLWAITWDAWQRIKIDVSAMHKVTRKKVLELAQAYSFFHWHVAFPHVFLAGKNVPNKDEATGWAGGFDVVLGNPPWERIKIQEQEFFASRNESIAKAANAAVRKKLIAALPKTDPTLWSDLCAESRQASGQSQLVRQSGRYPLCGKGDVNTYALFAEHNRHVLGPKGRAGFIVPTGIITEGTTKEFFDDLLSSRSIVSFWEFENEGFFSAGKGHMLRFGLFTLCGSAQQATADFFFQGQAIAELLDKERHFTLTREDLLLLNANSRTCPIFRTRRDAELTKAIYRRLPILLRDRMEEGEDTNPWNVTLSSMFHMTADASLFRTARELMDEGWSRRGNQWHRGGEKYIPLYEAKMIFIYTHRHGDYGDANNDERSHRLPEVPLDRLQTATYQVTPYWWVPEQDVYARSKELLARHWLIVWRDVTDARASARSVITAIIPRSGVANSLSMMIPSDRRLSGILHACLSSFVLDYVARQKIAGLHLNFLQMKQLAVPGANLFLQQCEWHSNMVCDWILPRVVELTYIAWDLEAFGKDCGYDGPPFRWDEDRRFDLRCELDAAFFHLYGIARDDVDYIMETFPIVRRRDVAAHGDYRTKHQILDIYDRMQHAIETGEPYQTLLDPPPADPRVAHPPREKKD